MTDLVDLRQRRRSRIGASDIAAGLTGSFGVTPAAIIAGKLGLLDENPPTGRMQLGLALEDRVIDAAVALLGLHVVDRQLEVSHPELHWLVATLDAVVFTADYRRAPLEVKTTSSPSGYPPDYLEAQLQTQMACLGSTVGYSAVYHTISGALDVATHRSHPDVLAAALGMAQELWDHLCDHSVPSPVFPADAAVWNRLHPESVAGIVELPAELVAELVAAREAAKRAENTADLLEATVKELLGDVDTGTVDGVPAIRWRTVTSKRVDLKSLEADAPDLVEQHRQEQTVRRFTLISPPNKHQHHQTEKRTQ